ncbi:hypothetical protein ASF26_15530 [Methylobacterium sp. Leaf93]|nr:hypothetical protein ASF26_15530 [Methylobacterium sp. Leaf93]
MLGAFPIDAAPTSRVRNALVIGIARYPDSDFPLPTTIGDARLVADRLKASGFKVELGEDLPKDRMRATIEQFLRKVEPGSTALVYFGGYGIQAGRRNYLIPLDAKIWNEADVIRDGISLDGLLGDLDKRGAAMRIVVLDASRRNPFERRFRSFSAGLAELKPSQGELTLSSAAAGSVLGDPRADTSPFATEIARQITVPDQSIDQALAAARDDIARDRSTGQGPVLVSGLPGAAALDSNRPSGAAMRPPVDGKPPRVIKTEPERPAVIPASKEADPASKDRDIDAIVAAEETVARDFNAASAKNTKAAFEDFVRRHPVGPLTKVALGEIARFDRAVAREPLPTPAAPPSPPVAMQAPPTPSSSPWRTPPGSYSMAELQRKATLDARISRQPRDALAYYERGQFHAQRYDYPAALADFDQAIRLEPKSPEALNNRCWVRAISNDLQKAMDDCNDALALRPRFLDALDSRGFVNLRSGSLRAAIADYDKAIDINANHSSALYGRGIAWSRLGDSSRANADLTRALSLNPVIDRDFAQYGLR